MVRPWIDSRAAIDEKAVPIRTARPSPRRAPASVSASAAAAARPALIAIGRKWTAPGICDLGLAEEMHHGSGQHGAGREQAEERHRPLTQQMGHATGIGPGCVSS